MSKGLGYSQLDILYWIYITAQRRWSNPVDLVRWKNKGFDKSETASTSRALKSLWKRGFVTCFSYCLDEELKEFVSHERGTAGFKQTRSVCLERMGVCEVERRFADSLALEIDGYKPWLSSPPPLAPED